MEPPLPGSIALRQTQRGDLVLGQSSGWFCPWDIYSVLWEFWLPVVNSPGGCPLLYRNAVLSCMHVRLCRIIGLHLRMQPEKIENQCVIGRQFQDGYLCYIYATQHKFRKYLNQWLLQCLPWRCNCRRNAYSYLSYSFLEYLLLCSQRQFPEMACLSAVMLTSCLNSLSKAKGDFSGLGLCFFLRVT